jgi:hypothetical protein
MMPALLKPKQHVAVAVQSGSNPSGLIPAATRAHSMKSAALFGSSPPRDQNPRASAPTTIHSRGQRGFHPQYDQAAVSHSDQSLVGLAPSTQCAAAALPHKKPAGKLKVAFGISASILVAALILTAFFPGGLTHKSYPAV